MNTRAASATREFETLLAGVVDVAYGVGYRLTRSRDDAEDLVQEAALQAFRNFHQFQVGTNFKAWFLRILTNAFFAKYRKQKRRPQTTSLEDAEPLFIQWKAVGLGLHLEHQDPAAFVMSRIGEEQIALAMNDLPEEFRVVCVLYFMQDASYQEIAEILECPVGTVRSRLHRGRRLLQKALWHVAEDQGLVPTSAAAEPRA